jgi:hypothetical protein
MVRLEKKSTFVKTAELPRRHNFIALVELPV